MEIKVVKTTNPKPKYDPLKVPFGTSFTDHMFLMEYDDANGWHDARIVPYENLSLDPGTMVFHYASEVFEGLKAYRTPDGGVQMFRPQENFARMNRSAERLCLPQFDEAVALEGLKQLVALDADWVPSEPGQSLYIRPVLIGTDIDIALHGIHKALFYIITCPVAAYYSAGLTPVDLLIEMEDVRAVRGGTGFTKCGGNYAAATRAGERAAAKGYSQVLWVDGVERKYVEEGGGMNVMFVMDGKLVTPELNGSILPGITRKSILELARSWGMDVEERKVSVEELWEGCKNGTVQEAFMCGTAAVVTPIGGFAKEDEKVEVNGHQVGEVTKKVYENLTGIQWGKVEDSFGWLVKVK